MKNNKNKELIITILFGWLGIHKFLNKQPEWGIAYLFTFGLLGVGWIYDIYACLYYNSIGFKIVKDSIEKNTTKCNELNRHIEDLKKAYVDIKHIDYGTASFSDKSLWNFSRPAMKNFQESNNIYNCSRVVCSNARKQPFKYICKYFDIKPTEENLEKFESVLNDFSAAEQGKELLKKERDEIINSISDKIPFLIMTFNKKNLIRKLGFENIDFSQLYFPKYTFKYVSSGGNSGMQCDIILDVENLDRFINYLSTIVQLSSNLEKAPKVKEL